MELYYEEEEKKVKKSKLPIAILICIILLVIVTCAIIYMIYYINSTTFTVNIDGVSNSEVRDIIDIRETESGNELYIPIRKIAKYLNYEDYSGDYKNKSEDKTKCYVKTDDEIAMFTLNSNILIKTRGDSDYESIEIDQIVFEKDGELYTTIDAIEKAFNVEFIYQPDDNLINIYTMDFLVTNLAAQKKIEDYSEEFSDKKAIFENMLIVIENKQYGVLNLETDQYVLEPKYDSISYLPYTQDFLVQSGKKYGVMSKDAKIKVKIAYDDIKILDNQNKMYLVKEGNLYGVIDTDGNTIIKSDYQTIGLEKNDFTENGVENQYILLDTLIPAKYNNLWGFFDLEGNQVTEFKFTGVGCTSSKITNAYPVVVVPSHRLIVVEKDKFYNFIDLRGNEKITTYVVDSVYLRTDASTGENTYYMTYNGYTRTVDDVLESS